LENEAYTVQDVAALLKFSRQTITLLFENEPGVLILKNGKRRSLRIPPAVYQRVVRKWAVR
jgi:hypothetical protein